MGLTTNQQYRDINFLIQHLKKDDIHLYEALNITNENMKAVADTIDKAKDPPPATLAAPLIQERYNFGLGQGGDIVVASEPTSYLTVEQPNGVKLFRWRIRANTAPTGADIVVDILKNGTSSIFASGFTNKIVLPAGQKKAKKENAFLTTPFNLKYEDELVPQVLQVGSTIKGFRIQIQLTALVL